MRLRFSTVLGLLVGLAGPSAQAQGKPQDDLVVLSQGDELPALQPNQLNLYTEQCAAGADRRAVPVGKPHELMAESIVALLAPASGPPLYDWSVLAGLPAGITWDDSLPPRDPRDRNPGVNDCR